MQSGASLVYNVARCAVNFFSSRALCVVKAAAKHPKISVTLGVIAGGASVAAVARKRFDTCCILEKISAYNPFKGKKIEEKKEEVVADEADAAVIDPKAEEVTPADGPAAADAAEEVDVETDVDTEVESPASSRSSSPRPALDKHSA